MASERAIIESFEVLRAAGFGARFYRTDLHFHSPASEDARGNNKYGWNPYAVKYPLKGSDTQRYLESVKEKQGEILETSQRVARQMVEHFLERKLNLVAVTDHNGIGTLWNDPDAGRPAMDLAAPTWYELIDDEAQRVNEKAGKTVLRILPGVEISTSDIHILGIFPPQRPRRKVHFIICDLLNEAGFEVEEWGRNPEVGKCSVYNTIELIARKGGLPVIAHADAHDKALFKLYKIKSGAMKDVLTNPRLAGIEFVESSTLERENKKVKAPLSTWINRLRKKEELAPLAFFQGSDAHSFKAIAQRYTYVKMTEPSFSGLKTAARIPHSRVRLGGDFRKLHPPGGNRAVCFYGMELHHPYFGRTSLRFNRYLNCVAGKLDSGKSTLFRLMQYPFTEPVAAAANQGLEIKSMVTLFIERITYSRKEISRTDYYALGREGGDRFFYTLAKDGNRVTATRADWGAGGAKGGEAANSDLIPYFYDPGEVNRWISSALSFSDLLSERFGAPNAGRIKEFNKTFAIPMLLTEEARQLLYAEAEGTGYKLWLDLGWNQGKEKRVEFSQLDNSLKRVVLLSLFLVSGHGRTGPLIIDAPEAYFNNEDIVRFLIPLFKIYKDFRQIILFTNHPLLAINTDPENFILLERRGNKTRMKSGFSIDDPGQKASLIDLMEGSLSTFNERSVRYGIDE